MNLAIRDIRRHLGRFLLTCIGVSLLLAIVMSMIGIYRGLVEDALTLPRAPRADIWIVEAGSRGPFAEASRIPADTREAVARLQGVAEAGALTYQAVEASYHEQPLRLFVVGYEPGRPGGPRAITEGREITRSHYELIVDRRSGLTLGDAIRLGRREFTVVGLTRGEVASGGDPVAYMTLLDAQRLQFELEPASARQQRARGAAVDDKQTVNAVVARVLPNADPQAIAKTVERWKHLSATTQAEQEEILTGSMVRQASRQIGLFTSLLLAVSTVIISLIIYMMTMDKRREIATLKLIGASDLTIVGLIVQQAVSMGMLGYVVGGTLIALGKDYFPRKVVMMPTDDIALGGVVLAICLIASALGVRLALKIDPATALSG